VDVKNTPYFVPTSFFDWTSNPLAYNASRTITTCVEPFPITDPDLILEYTIHHTLNQPWDSCCTSPVLDTIPIPPCSVECCTDYEAFCDRVDAGFNVANNPNNCTISVSPLALNECDQVRWSWGDGAISNGMWNTSVSHTYPLSGVYGVCMIVGEVDSNGEICWEKEFCREVEVNCLHWQYCDPIIDLGTTTLFSGTVHAQNEVISSGTVPQGTDVSLKAGQCIRLDSGFSSDANADLEIIIEDCQPDVPD